MVVIAILYVFGAQIGTISLAMLTGGFFLIAVVSLVTAIKTNVTYSFYYATKTEKDRKLGGDELTAEAARIQRQRSQTEQQMLEDAQGEKDLIWTKRSQAAVNIRSTLSFIGLIGFGTCSLASAAMLVSVFVASSKPS